jgi:hypothetical protein
MVCGDDSSCVVENTESTATTTRSMSLKNCAFQQACVCRSSLIQLELGDCVIRHTVKKAQSLTLVDLMISGV